MSRWNWWQKWKWCREQNKKLGRWHFKEWHPEVTHLEIEGTNFHRELRIRRNWIQKL
jgi:hypothetical protein